jgi:hypothetical protein
MCRGSRVLGKRTTFGNGKTGTIMVTRILFCFDAQFNAPLPTWLCDPGVRAVKSVVR